jgi:hypothetical protein
VAKFNYVKQLFILNKYFTSKTYFSLLQETNQAYLCNDFKRLDELMEQFPTEHQLLGMLVEKLKGKSVYITLKKITEGKVKNQAALAKGLSSLLTHTLVEVEQGNSEYKLLMEDLVKKLNVELKKL